MGGVQYVRKVTQPGNGQAGTHLFAFHSEAWSMLPNKLFLSVLDHGCAPWTQWAVRALPSAGLLPGPPLVRVFCF